MSCNSPEEESDSNTSRWDEQETEYKPSTSDEVNEVDQPDYDYQPVFHNFVATVGLGIVINLQQVCMRVRCAEYEPSRFTGLILRLHEPKVVAMLFHTGNLVVTGAKTEAECRLGARKIVRLVQRVGYPKAKFVDYKVRNSVATVNVMFPINIEAMCVGHCNFTTYEPELFPALIYRVVNPAVVLLVFVSGKIVITGGKSRREVHTALKQMYPVFNHYRIETRAEQEMRKWEEKDEESAGEDKTPSPPPMDDATSHDEEESDF